MARGWKNLACKAQSTENAAKTEFQFVRFEPKLQLGWMFFDISLLLASFIRLFVYSLTFQPFFLCLPFPRSAAKTNLQRSFLILILHITPYQTVFCFQTPFFFTRHRLSVKHCYQKNTIIRQKVDYHKSLATFIEDVDNVDH